MNTKLLTGLVLLILVGQNLFGQTKSYNGSFNSMNFQGTATYDYIEKPESRVFDGSFTFKTTNNSVNINGNYKNDMKDGVWYFNLKNVANTDIIMKYLVTANVSGTFKEGKLDGSWNLTKTKNISFSKSGISEYYQFNINTLSYLFDGQTVDFDKTTTVTEKSSANFTNNHFSGNFTNSINNGKSVVKGQFNEQGYFDGSWTVNYYQDGILHYQTRTYQNGVLLTIKNKDNSTGNVTTVYDKTIEVQEFFQNYKPNENSSKIGEAFYKLKEEKTKQSDITFMEDAIEIWYNNTSIATSAYLYEIEIGSEKMSVYPEQKIVYDSEKIEKYKEEQERIAEELRKKKEAEEEKERQIELAKKRQEQERLREEERKKREFENSDYGKISSEIKIEFEAWLEKGEFETNSEYEARIKNKSDETFNSITESVIKSIKDEYLKPIFKVRLDQYNAENQTLSLITFFDTLIIKVSALLAKDIFDKNCMILIFPEEVIMQNNKWKLSKANVLFDFSEGIQLVWEQLYIGNKKVSNSRIENGKFKYTCWGENIQKKLVDLKTVNTDQFPKAVVNYAWDITEESSYKESSVQSVTFTIEDLEIVLPIK